MVGGWEVYTVSALSQRKRAERERERERELDNWLIWIQNVQNVMIDTTLEKRDYFPFVSKHYYNTDLIGLFTHVDWAMVYCVRFY